MPYLQTQLGYTPEMYQIKIKNLNKCKFYSQEFVSSFELLISHKKLFLQVKNVNKIWITLVLISTKKAGEKNIKRFITKVRGHRKNIFKMCSLKCSAHLNSCLTGIERLGVTRHTRFALVSKFWQRIYGIFIIVYVCRMTNRPTMLM